MGNIDATRTNTAWIVANYLFKKGDHHAARVRRAQNTDKRPKIPEAGWQPYPKPRSGHIFYPHPLP